MYAAAWLAQAYLVAVPLGSSSDYDLLAEIRGKIARVQVKTTRVFHKNRWVVSLATRGGNQSWSGLVKRFSSTRCDYLYAHTACGRRWFIPSKAVEGGNAILLGGPKYQAYEVDEGSPLTVL